MVRNAFGMAIEAKNRRFEGPPDPSKRFFSYFFELGFEESAFFYVDWSGLELKSSFERPIHEKSDFFLIF